MKTFLKELLPGNYWLSKSMEFSKIENSGTLWYLKKFIVYYNYLLLKNDFFENDEKEINANFNTFISTLDNSLKKTANDYFFQNNNILPAINFFATTVAFKSIKEKTTYFVQAKRFYFMAIMGIGGQRGYKKDIRELIESGNSYEEVKNRITKKMKKNGENERSINQILADYPASIRNERQIYFYYGIISGNENSLNGFCNLTAIGRAIMFANFHELLIIWEHQKLKMISQSPVADIRNLTKNGNIYPNKFGILYNPYSTLLNIINKRKNITRDEYQFVISKIKNSSDNEIIINKILGDESKISIIKKQTESFKRSGDLEDEDFSKEIKKYILGICDMSVDNGKNYFQCLDWYTTKAGLNVTDNKKLSFISNNYDIISEYNLKACSIKLDSFEKELKSIYQANFQKSQITVSDNIKYDWYYYIINFDLEIIMSLIYTGIALQLKNYSYDVSQKEIKNFFNVYSNLLKFFQIGQGEFVKKIKSSQEQLLNRNIEISADSSETYSYNPIELSLQANIDQIIKLSNTISLNNLSLVAKARTRNSEIINKLRGYYYSYYREKNTNLIKCDCCNDTTFLNQNDVAYIEFHHLIPFSTDSGPDHLFNLFGICPSCHRKLHFAKSESKFELYKQISSKNNLNITIIERVNHLFDAGILESIHIEFLKKEKIITSTQYELLMSNQKLVA